MKKIIKKSDVFVYIAGKYTDTNMLNIERHILDALDLGIKCAKHGIYYMCPHTHSRFMDFYAPDVSWEYWMDVDLRVIETLANCLLMVHNYKESKGAMMEHDKAKELGYPIFYDFQSFLEWYNSLED